MGRQVRLAAKGDDGRDYTVVIAYTTMDVSDLANPGATMEGLPHLLLSTGQDLSRVRKGVYEIMDTGVVITTDDPRAI